MLRHLLITVQSLFHSCSYVDKFNNLVEKSWQRKGYQICPVKKERYTTRGEANAVNYLCNLGISSKKMLLNVSAIV